MQIIQWDKLKYQIENSKDIEELTQLKSRMRAYQILAEQSRQSVEVQAKIAIYKARIDRKCGEWLKENIKHEGAKGKIKEHLQGSQDVTPVKLKDINITKNESSRLQKIADIPEKKFNGILEEAETETKKVTNNMLVRIAKEMGRKERIFNEDTSLPAVKTEKGKYNVIYADPPWDIGSMVLEKWKSPLKDKYPTMTLEKLKALDVQNLSAKDCVCFMWSTLSTVPIALELLEHWGFKYHITITWDKGNGWSANGFHRKTELVLFGYRGKLSNVIKQEGKYIPTLFYEAKTTHSTKPQKMYEFIERSAGGKKIELFARDSREGWAVWGNEVNGNN